MAYLLSIVGGIIFFVIVGFYTTAKLSIKKRAYIDIGIFLVMLVTSICLKSPFNLCVVALFFLAWVLLGYLLRYIRPRLYLGIGNLICRLKGEPCSEKFEDEDYTGSNFACKFSFYTIELMLIILYVVVIIINSRS